jgi:hypothetical protein
MTRWNKETIRLGGGSIGIVLVSMVLALAQMLGSAGQTPIL